jgi:hypothetical protein
MPGYLRMMDEWCECMRTILGEVTWMRGRIRWLGHAPYTFRVDQGLEDPSSIEDAEAVHVELPNPVDTVGKVAPPRWWSWTREVQPDGSNRWGSYYHDGSKALENPLFRDNSNPYGLLPFAVLRDREPPAGEFFLPAREVLLKAQYWVNTLLTDERWGLIFGIHNVPVFKGLDDPDLAPKLDPGRPLWSTSNNPDFDMNFRSPTPNLAEARKSLEDFLRMYAVSEGMPADIWSGQGATRNLAAKKMDAHALMLRREARMSTYREFISRMWAIHTEVTRVHRGKDIYRGIDLEVSYADIPYPEDPQSEALLIQAELAMDLTNPVEVLMKRRGITRDKAEELLAENRRLNAALPGRQAPTLASATPNTPPDVRG